MGLLTSLFKPEIKSIEEAERAIFRAFYVGFLTMVVGFALIFTIFLMPEGIALMAIGGIILAANIVWIALASHKNKIVKKCPRCSKPNTVFAEERYFKCADCGFHAVLREI